MGAWLAVSLSKSVLPMRSSPAAAPARESVQSAQVREATAHWLVFEPFGFQARLARLPALREPVVLPLAV